MDFMNCLLKKVSKKDLRVDIFRAKNFVRNRNLYRKYSIIHIGIWDYPFVSERQTLPKLCTSACLLSSIEL